MIAVALARQRLSIYCASVSLKFLNKKIIRKQLYHC